MNRKTKAGLLAAPVIAALAFGGVALAGGAGDDDATERPIPGSANDRAGAVAVKHVGGGQVTGTEVGDEEGYYEVEVTRPGGEVDVHLDRDFKVTSTEDDGNERSEGDER